MRYTDRQRLDGKTVLVTGGTGLLGREFCEGYAQCGANVAIADLDEANVTAFARELRARTGAATLGVRCDVAEPMSVGNLLREIVAAFGGIDVVHSNAATKGSDIRAFFTPFEEYPLELWREIMSVNLDGMFLVAQRAGRQLIAQGRGGSLILTSSIYGLVGADPGIYEGSHYLGGAINTPAVYSASKAAVIGLTRHLATHWAKHSIRVNCLAPGGVASGQNEEFAKRYSARVPLGRMARSEEMVGAALFLASDAASYVTGQVLAVDGGWTAW